MIKASTTYANVSKTLQYIHDVTPRITLSVLPLAFPLTHAEILETFRKHLRSLLRLQDPGSNPNPKIVCIIDSVIASPGIYMPWKEMVQICKEEGVISIVDAAHSLGQETNINLAEIRPDFWFSVGRGRYLI